MRTKAIASAKVKTDKVDAQVLAQLLAADFIAEVWVPDPTLRALRRRVSQRSALIHQQSALRNRVHAVLNRNLLDCPATDLCGKAGRQWLSGAPLPPEERQQLEAPCASWALWRLRSRPWNARSPRLLWGTHASGI